MPALTKTRPAVYRDETARAKLALAQAQLAAVTAEIEPAQVEHTAAGRRYREQQFTVQEIRGRISDLRDQLARTPAAVSDDVVRRIDECHEPLARAKMPLMDLARAEEAAAAKLKDAQSRVTFYRYRVKDTAEAVVRAEASQVSEVLAARVRNAFADLATFGPDLTWLLSHSFAVDDVGDGPRSVLSALHTWDAFHARYAASPWASAVAALEADADAILPTVPN